MIHRERIVPYLFLLPAIGLLFVFNLFADDCHSQQPCTPIHW